MSSKKTLKKDLGIEKRFVTFSTTDILFKDFQLINSLIGVNDSSVLSEMLANYVYENRKFIEIYKNELSNSEIEQKEEE